nr:hypothetical protein [Tanacetum cinerariifolium]
MALTFADTHNMIAFLTKSDASEGFEQIIIFLNAHVIKYALMVNSTIYVSCIKQFWTSVSIKKSNDVVRLQALIDRKKVIITEDYFRQALRLDDVDSVDCLPNEEIFVVLARMGYEKPLLIPCPHTKGLCKYEDGWKGILKGPTPLFTGMLVPQQAQDVEDAAEDEDAVNEVSDVPTSPSPTPATLPSPPQQEHIPSPPQAAIAQPSPPPQQQPSHNAELSMTLLNTLLKTYATLTKQVANLEQDKVAQAIEITKLKQIVRRRMHPNMGEIAELDAYEDVTLEEVDAEVPKDADVQGRLDQAKVYHLDLEHADKVLSMQETDKAEPAEEAATASLSVQSEVKSKDKGKGILVEEPKPLKRLAQIEQDEAFARELEAKLNANINWNEVIEQVKRKGRQDNTIMRYQALKRKLVTEAHARKNMMVYLKNMAGFKMDFFKGMTYTDIRPIFEKHFNSIWAFLKKGEKEIEEEESKRKSENLEQKAAKK